VTDATWSETARRWTVTTDRGETLSARFCVMATGCLSVPLKPDIEGMEAFKGVSVQTSLWPREDRTEEAGRIDWDRPSGVQSTPETLSRSS
jgi:cyclohexanone monooxygenase